jgi:protein-disulfide isomerase
MNFLRLGSLLAMATVAPLAGQSPEMKAIDELRKGQAQMQNDIAEIKKILEDMRPKPPKPFEPIDISILGAPVKGDSAAKVTIVEFTDYQCPYCSRHVQSTLAQLEKEYIATGKVRYILREYPITAIHAQAAKASEAALCAGDQGKYWEMHNMLFANQTKLQEADLLSHGKNLGLNEAALKSCLDQKKYEARVKNDIAEGNKAGVTGTPTFFLGPTDANDKAKVRVTKLLRGALPFASFKQAVDELLAAAPPANKGATGSD